MDKNKATFQSFRMPEQTGNGANLLQKGSNNTTDKGKKESSNQRYSNEDDDQVDQSEQYTDEEDVEPDLEDIKRNS